ncbi:hypothetical protein [Gordonia alkanivorans]|uniref:hypothetical protein n=1 Tax=Gordonia alkanivorans TaxID=84096 RepID=UPI0024B6E820|nr:hypothetical protein [Gordonia alkanivorans]MDJ0008206.1 hypothetical protein [Gordonia alkanivorans]MDJ0097893.1 hypothetical protein [Gordonia alkanivorans]MDJ0493781.1 hypothetical protein [Gordonia alkanivorans]
MNEAGRLDDYITAALGNGFQAWPGGWPGEIEAALVDAVFSIRARYGGPESGVRGVVKRWRERDGRTGKIDDLEALAAADPVEFVRTVNNSAQASGRLKGEIVVDAANALTAVGLRHASDFTNSIEQKNAYLSVKGCGSVTWSYFGMLLGEADVKADTWIVRFVEKALARPARTEEARELLATVATMRDVSATALDHAVWEYARKNLG